MSAAVPATGIGEPARHVLASLFDGPLPGSAIITFAGQLSEGRVRLVTGTLYTLLDRLAAEGYVRVAGRDAVTGQVRCRYALTRPGLSALQASASRRTQGAGPVAGAGHSGGAGKIAGTGGGVRVAGDEDPMTAGAALPAAAACLPGRLPQGPGRGDGRHAAGDYAGCPDLAAGARQPGAAAGRPARAQRAEPTAEHSGEPAPGRAARLCRLPLLYRLQLSGLRQVRRGNPSWSNPNYRLSAAIRVGLGRGPRAAHPCSGAVRLAARPQSGCTRRGCRRDGCCCL